MKVVNSNEKENVISVTGYGRLFIDPNYLNISISLGCRSNNMKTSLEGINSNMKELFELIKQYNIEENLVHVVDLRFGPEYEWKNNVNEFMGYDVDQKINIEMDVTKENEEKARKIIGEIASLKFLNDCDIEYGLKNKKKHLETVRELSFKNALEKAEQYAALADVRIVKANTISDRDSGTVYSRSNSRLEEDAEYSAEASDSYLPAGRKIVLENTVYVTFDIAK
jgi:uncharacterized protein YggE